MGLCGFLICSLRQIYPLNPMMKFQNPMLQQIPKANVIFYKKINPEILF